MRRRKTVFRPHSGTRGDSIAVPKQTCQCQAAARTYVPNASLGKSVAQGSTTTLDSDAEKTEQTISEADLLNSLWLAVPSRPF